MKKIMGLDANSNSCVEQLANKTTNGDCTELANKGRGGEGRGGEGTVHTFHKPEPL